MSETKMIILTDEAKEQVVSALAQQPGKTALRVEAKTTGSTEFSYGMKLIGQEERTPEDLIIEAGELQIVLDPKSAEYLKGATIDYEEGIVRTGFKFRNPNRPETPKIGDGPSPDLTGSVAERIQRLIDTELNPAVAAHGGVIQFLGVQDNKAYLGFGGGCHGCGMVDVTLKQGVEARIRELIPEIEEVVDTTDHSTGENPFYT
ncbi:iron-sulfur cluster assembly accessory protein [Acidobacteria bacterium AH-259-O06]|nr:iron-sulfur cluster assembly accessory protein [Acidobacteria bacterium AH-259-O06]